MILENTINCVIFRKIVRILYICKVEEMNMAIFGDPDFHLCKLWIESKRYDIAGHPNKTWEELDFALRKNDERLQNFLSEQAEVEDWPVVTVPEWHESIRLMRRAEESQPPAVWRGDGHIGGEETDDGGNVILPPDILNHLGVPNHPRSAWQLYSHYLKNVEHWPDISVSNLQQSALFLLNRLGIATDPQKPIQGLVLGYVQSGKTANMEALIAMAADHGWNLFIILGGTKDNLREQTRDRIIADLTNNNGNLNWRGIEQPQGDDGDAFNAAENLFLNERDRYVTVCLKQPDRLKRLIGWITGSERAHKKMKMLIIDDEADQASINNQAARNTRTTINQLIVNLVQDNQHVVRGQQINAAAVNYLMYTATPYANFLNETGRESLYPRHFIYSLEPPREYLGPNQWFGGGAQYGDDGLDIKRIISPNEVGEIKRVQKNGNGILPTELQKSIAWFYCCVAIMRHWYPEKPRPVSMLIHTSQNKGHHEKLADGVKKWIAENRCNGSLKELCRSVYSEEIRRETKEKWLEQLPSYGDEATRNSIKNYPSFNDFETHLDALLSADLRYMPINTQNKKPVFEGYSPYIAIDNSANNGIDDNNEKHRLLYPDRHETNHDHIPQFCPAYIVIGGNTLSRGLTIEGLVSTYFLRTSNQYDTLMQMGRWFGYRRGYELLPRLWISQATLEKFEFLAEQELSLREELKYFGRNGKTPAQYSPCITLSGRAMSWLRPTRKGAMTSAVAAEYDFGGARPQTITFDSNPDIQLANITLTENFISDLGREYKISYNENSIYWEGISLNCVKDFLREFHFCSRGIAFQNMDDFLKFLDETEHTRHNWNVIVIGVNRLENGHVDSSQRWDVQDKSLGKVSRSKLAGINDPSILSLKAITAPLDRLNDVESHYIDEYREANGRTIKEKDIAEIRKLAGVNDVPQLIIYRIDKDSKAERGKAGVREDLNSAHDLIGIQVCIPGSRSNFISAVRGRLPDDNEADELEQQD